MRGLFTLALLLYVLPLTAFGATFAKESLFLSKSPVTEGESVLIHAVVSNNSNTKFSGKLLLSEGEVAIGSVAVSLEAQGAQVTSVSWKPNAGTHKISAKLTETDGSVVEENSASFTVNSKKDTSTASGSSDVDSSDAIQNSIAGISPGVAQSAAPVFSTIDGLRAHAAGALDKATDWAKKSGNKGKVQGVATENESEGGIVTTIWSFIMTILIFIFSLLKYLVTHAALFYPILAIAFIYGLWRLYKRMRRPSFQ